MKKTIQLILELDNKEDVPLGWIKKDLTSQINSAGFYYEVKECMEIEPDKNKNDKLISRQEAIDAVCMEWCGVKYQECEHPFDIENDESYWCDGCETVLKTLPNLPSVQPERKWIPCSNPPKHHRDVIVRGTEFIGNVTVHKVMQWDVDTWRPTDYAPSIRWDEWSEI